MTDGSGSPIAQTSTSPAAGNLHDVYQRLREAILAGTLAGGEIINQVELSRRFGVSRTPVREALRMLQAEGLVESEFQKRMRVTAVSPDEIDAVYATWILVDALCVSLTIPRITDADVAAIDAALKRMIDAAGAKSAAGWEAEHRAFHDLLVMHGGPILQANIALCWDRSERTRQTRARAVALSWHTSDDEHVAIARAYARRSVADAVQGMSRHLARTAVSVIGQLDPGYEPRAIRQALNMVSRPDAVSIAAVSDAVEIPSMPKRRRG
jgi:DNA-binding GntR family transcriptional regulator